MENLTRDQIINKWGDLVKSICKFEKPEDIAKISEYAHHVASVEQAMINSSGCLIPGVGTDFHRKARQESGDCRSMLPLQLNVVSQIKDLSNVHFTKAPVYEHMNFVKEVDSTGALCLKKQSTCVSVDTIKHVLKIDKDLVQQLAGSSRLTEIIEQYAVEMVCKTINEIITKPKTTLYIYIPIERIKRCADVVEIITEDQIDDNYVVYWIYSRWKEKFDESITLNDI
jgi:hypothetical protein